MRSAPRPGMAGSQLSGMTVRISLFFALVSVGIGGLPVPAASATGGERLFRSTGPEVRFRCGSELLRAKLRGGRLVVQTASGERATLTPIAGAARGAADPGLWRWPSDPLQAPRSAGLGIVAGRPSRSAGSALHPPAALTLGGRKVGHSGDEHVEREVALPPRRLLALGCTIDLDRDSTKRTIE